MFRSRLDNNLTELESWLDVATDGLCEDAQARIRGEVTSHYEDALQHARARGLAERDALDEALLSLGEPGIARRQLRRQHLTAKEVRRLERESGGDGRWRGYAVSLFLLPGCLVFMTFVLWAGTVRGAVYAEPSMGLVVVAVGLGLYLLLVRMYRWWRWLRNQDAMTRLWYRASYNALFAVCCLALFCYEGVQTLTAVDFSVDTLSTGFTQLLRELNGLFLFVTFREGPDTLLMRPMELLDDSSWLMFLAFYVYFLHDCVAALRTHAKLGRIQSAKHPTTPAM